MQSEHQQPAARERRGVDQFGFWIGDIKVTTSYAADPTKIGLYRPSGEGGDFDLAEVNAVLRKFYEEHF